MLEMRGKFCLPHITWFTYKCIIPEPIWLGYPIVSTNIEFFKLDTTNSNLDQEESLQGIGSWALETAQSPTTEHLQEIPLSTSDNSENSNNSDEKDSSNDSDESNASWMVFVTKELQG